LTTKKENLLLLSFQKVLTSQSSCPPPAGDRPAGSIYGYHKVNRKRLSSLMVEILLCIGDGIERGVLVKHVFGLERRYCGYFSDPCLRGKQKRDYEDRYRRAQPVVTRTLKRMEKRGLVQLIRHSKYVKQVSLTEEGRIVARRLEADGRLFPEISIRE